MKKLVVLRPKIFSYIINNACIDKKVNGTKMSIIKQEIKLKIVTSV